ncbi:hypothetical protein A3J90_07605 [candidate division WOR-1 bacterium RIFOXYC2_FULL_37_10]|nr:MAG: hypothetical protein A3J90_07605 [candidate division WOR-1 bacterium RIFOXYC2_FULL_37_10]
MVGFGGTSPIFYASGEAVNGRVGIGTTEPTSKLTVAGTIEIKLGSNGTLKFSDGTNQTTAYTGVSASGGWIKNNTVITTEASISNVGIGTAEPVASFEVAGGILAQGTNGDIPVTGNGTRLMWIPSIAAFRAGTVTGGTEWNVVGFNSFAVGGNTIATGISSTAMGNTTTANGQYSVAMGNNTTAIGSSSTAMGDTTTASGNSSIAMGNNTIASGGFSTAMGNTTTASGSSSTAMGNNTIASGTDSTAMGNNTTAIGTASIAAGQYLTTEANNSIVLGRGISSTNSDRLNNNKANSLMVGFGGVSPILYVSGEAVNGRVGIGTTEPTVMLDVSGEARVRGLTSTGNHVVYATADGTLTNSSSDMRLKKNVETISDKIDVLESLKNLRGVYYNWDTTIDGAKDLGDQKEIGMIAQEVEEVFPEVVGTDNKGYKILDYPKLTAFLIEVNKKQQEKIDDQENRLKLLEDAVFNDR